MQLSESICMKFPTILKYKLLNHEVELPDSTLFEYEKIKVYRAVERKKDDFREVDLNDFKSYFELGKLPKKVPRGKSYILSDPHYYGVSSFLDKEIVKQLMRFPNPNKKMITGYVYQEGGPQDTNGPTKHICWWLYENVDVSDFKLLEEGESYE